MHSAEASPREMRVSASVLVQEDSDVLPQHLGGLGVELVRARGVGEQVSGDGVLVELGAGARRPHGGEELVNPFLVAVGIGGSVVQLHRDLGGPGVAPRNDRGSAPEKSTAAPARPCRATCSAMPVRSKLRM